MHDVIPCAQVMAASFCVESFASFHMKGASATYKAVLRVQLHSSLRCIIGMFGGLSS